MSDEIEVSPETAELALLHKPDALSISRDPLQVIEEAVKAAQALKQIIDAKPQKKKVFMNGEPYLVYEDWLTVGRFYGVTVQVRETHFLEMGEFCGFEAIADVLLVSTNQVISSAEAMCLNDEPKWASRPKYDWVKGDDGRNHRQKVGEEPVPLFQLRSMAQTRACAKALRNVLAWVVVLAGYNPTPSEEMTEPTDSEQESAPYTCCSDCGEYMTRSETELSKKKFKRTLCGNCQKQIKTQAGNEAVEAMRETLKELPEARKHPEGINAYWREKVQAKRQAQ